MFKVIALMGKAGSGKDALLHELIRQCPDANEMISCTTRPIREGEIHGVNYFYMTPEEFGARVLNGEMLECTFRRYIENKYHWYNMTIHVSELEPSVAVVFERDITASGLDINQTISKAEHDGLTDLFNIEKYGSLLPTEYASMESAGVIYADIEHLSEFNEKYGRDVGDEAIKILAESMRSVQNRQNLVYRCGDDEFMLISKNTSNEEIEILKQLVKERLSRLSDIRNVHFVASFGSAWETNVTDIAKVISTAVTDMRNNKTLELLLQVEVFSVNDILNE